MKWPQRKLVSERGKLKRKMDIDFSWIIRIRDGWRCVKCQKQFEPPTKALQCSHFFSKGSSPATRYDRKNCDSLCASCHDRHGDNKAAWYRQFKIKQLGEKEYKLLEIRAGSSYHIPMNELQILAQIIHEERKTAERGFWT